MGTGLGEEMTHVYLFLMIVGTVAVVLVVALSYDLRARRHRRLSADFAEAARLSSRGGERTRRAADARGRPSKMGRRDGPPLGPGF